MSFHPSQKFIYTTPTTTTWLCPPDINYVDIIVIGGGGGGAGGSGGGGGGYSGGLVGGGGGASGGCGLSGNLVNAKNIKVTPGTFYSITIGSAGTGGSAGGGGSYNSNGGTGGAGTAGGNSSFTFPNGMSFVATGGSGGVAGESGRGSSGSSNGVGGTSANSYSYTSYRPAGPFPADPTGSDGSQAGTSGGTGFATLTASMTQVNNYYIYKIYTDVAGSVIVYPGLDQYYGPFGNSNTCVSGNYVVDTEYPLSSSSLGGAFTLSGGNVTFSTSYGGGAGGIMQLINPIPIYMIGVDFNTITSSNKLILPFITSSSGDGLGYGGSADSGSSSGGTPSSSYIGMWRDGTATSNITGICGAGGIGGPGGGGGSDDPGGSGYHGDNGLPGMIMITAV